MQPTIFGYASWYFMWSVAGVVGTVVNFFMLRWRGVSALRAAVILILTPFAAVLGAKLAHAIENGVALTDALSTSGFRMPGGLIAMAITLPALCLLVRVPILTVLDALAPSLGLVIAIGRLGCFMNGCCFGIPTDLPWAVVFPAESEAHLSHRVQGLVGEDATASLPVHPLSLYFAVDGLAIMLFLIWLGRRAQFPGQVFLWFVALRGWSKFALEGLRGFAVGSDVNRSGDVEFWLALAASATLLALAAIRHGHAKHPVRSA